MTKEFQQLQDFIIRFCLKELRKTVSQRDLSRDTKLEDDLGITGEDADYFFESFIEEFNVSVKHFPGRKYIGHEGEATDFIWPILRSIFGIKKKWIPIPKEERLPLTLKMLEYAIITGKLEG